MKRLQLITASLLSLASISLAAEPVTVKLTDKVLVKDVERLGVHFGGDTFYDSVILKQRVAENFEGTVERLHVAGDAPQPDPTGLYLFGQQRFLEGKTYIGATAHILSGPELFQTRKVVGIEVRDHATGNRKGKTHFVKLDKPVNWGTDWNNGLLLDNSDTTKGQRPWLVEKREEIDGKRVWSLEPDKQYVTPDTVNVATGDTPPEVGGHAAMIMDGSKADSWVKFRVQFYDAAPYDGTWTVKFWAKAKSGQPKVVVRPTVPGTSETATASDSWTQHTVKLNLDKPKSGENPIFMLELKAEDGVVLVDNVQASRDGDGKNSTPFRDELVHAMQFLNPGSIRYLRNNRDTYINSVLPRLENFSQRATSQRRDDFGTHEFYVLCDYLDADPWATLPGTITPEEIDQMMEYHAAPADVGLGKLRARLGQETPWTDVFNKIHIQFGNEVVTFFGTGYQGPDYWEALVKRAKASKYYDPDKFVFHLNEQGGGLKRLFGYHPDFDRGTINGYHIFGVYKDQIEMAKDKPGFYDFVFASAWHMWMDEQNNKNWSNLVATRDLGKELSIYEGGNYHSTFSTPNDAPLEQINLMNAGKAGGVSATNTMLILLKNWGARTQQNFNLSQEQFKPGGSFGNLPGAIRGWGGILNIGDDNARRYRPRFLAIRVANEVVGGDLIETQQTPDRKFSVTNKFGAGYGPSRNPEQLTVKDVPRLYSYGFAEGKRRGLILVSADPRETQTVAIEFDGKPTAPPTTWLVDSPGLEDTNELDWAKDKPQVVITEDKVLDFRSGSTVELPPGAMMSIEWTIE